tara:strand:+ start:1011 stop:1241 length:231 start_codon:yes stop_codon:yes gene_type:complete
MTHISHELVRTLKVRLTKEGRQLYFGTDKCLGELIALPYEEYYKIQGRVLLEAGACPILINKEEFYLFEDNEVEIL